MSTLADLADRLRGLHHATEPLVLPNVWDAATAHNVVEAGFAAVATTSSGVSAALGYADGEHTPPDEMFWAIQRIVRVAQDAPVTADIEAGYGLSPEELVARLLEAGAVGCNLEDTDHSAADHALRDAEIQADRLAAVKRAGRARGVDIVLNARVDVFLRGTAEGAVEEAVHRGKLYVDAGADCVFPIGVSDEAAIVALVKGIPGPVNVIPGFRGAPPLAKLRELGVRRISYAGRLFRSMSDNHRAQLEQIKSWKETF
jgi:2-methylisocitrate lyase-like PEP mutase family enzyme